MRHTTQGFNDPKQHGANKPQEEGLSSFGQRQQEGHDHDDEAQRQRKKDEEEEERTGEGRGPLGQEPFPGALGRIHLRVLALASGAVAEHKGAHL